MQFQVTIPTAKGDDFITVVSAESEAKAKRVAFESEAFRNLGVVKKGNIIVKLIEEQPKQLVVIDGVFPESLPSDFRTNPSYLAKVDEFVAKVSGLVPEESDEGEKQIIELGTKINKSEKALLGFVKQVFDAETAEVSAWKNDATKRIKLLGEARKSMLAIFDERKKERLATVRTLLIEELTKLYDESKITADLRKMDISALVLLSSITPSGKLTKRAQEALNTRLYDAVRIQSLIDKRVLIINNECFKEGINPPITKEYLGDAFLADEQVFMAKLIELVEAELKKARESR
ncbi:hypothetical protein [Methylocucumis oryzae]|uniref:Uncharacterized protein n=1 Tax=Methylocucumis oryzae TaxID=1632867 RepID=A0A0F3IMS3_9GAMM|nr:hypothetical protein [Methylocucumis oryzae]KJV08006.1 hypothetical protein VZ94_00890 [Methylocucumis oryzae]